MESYIVPFKFYSCSFLHHCAYIHHWGLWGTRGTKVQRYARDFCWWIPWDQAQGQRGCRWGQGELGHCSLIFISGLLFSYHTDTRIINIFSYYKVLYIINIFFWRISNPSSTDYSYSCIHVLVGRNIFLSDF